MKNEIIRCECVDMSVDGQGIAKCGDLVVFVKGMIKGEIAEVKIIAEKKNYSYGIIDRMIKASPYRRESECAVSYKCGGCDYRYIDYDYQLQLKKEVLENTLRPCKVNDIIPDDDPYFYRNKVQIPVRDHKMGFYRKYSNDIVEFSDCCIESALANAIFKDLKQLLLVSGKDTNVRHILIRHAMGTGEVMLGLIVRSFAADYSEIAAQIADRYPQIKAVILNLNDKDTNVILGSEERVIFGRDHIYDEFAGLRVKLSLKSFYQVNRNQMLKLYAQIYELADVSENDEVLDLYCGIGTISLYMARHVRHVTGVEIVEAAVANAKDNAAINHLNNADFILADATKDMDEYLKEKDLVIVDPPRKGINRQLTASLISLEIPKIIYVSCNPATLARDLELLKDHYEVRAIQPVDMFPFTTHVECVVCMQRKDR